MYLFIGEFATHSCSAGNSKEEIGNSEFGATILIHQPEYSGEQAEVTLSNVEIYNAGQAFRKGRYPIHFDFNGHMKNSYVRACSIHHTFNRAVNIRNTHDLLVEHNVVYDVMGTAISIEDGIETGNVLQYNLIVGVKASSHLQNGDITPAGILITHPNNTVSHNHVAGGTHFGFWYQIPEHPDGASFDPDIWPQNATLAEAFNNTAHSLGQSGLLISDKYDPPDVRPAEFEKFIAWNNMRGAEAVNVGGVRVVDLITLNNDISGIEYLYEKHPPNDWPGTEIGNVVIISHHQEDDHPPATKRGIVLPCHTGFKVDNVDFINFDGDEGRNSACIGNVMIPDIFSVHCAGHNSKFSNVTFINSPFKAKIESEFEFELEDVDGSLTGTVPGSRVVAASNLLPPDRCTVHPDWSHGLEGLICTPANGKPVDFIRFAFNNPQPSSLRHTDVTVTNQ